ncbi:hypothetical protein [Streptomyces sp. NPDC048172]|uniref:hypothetical protein n=1 Tax=Streptomyces sp. NPDC048172 TaxID=3365505 RepID=UPI003723D295
MDVEAAAALVAAAGTAVGTGAAGAAGESAWQSLAGLARRATGRVPDRAPGRALGRAPGGPEDAAEPDGVPVDTADPVAVRDFAALLLRRAVQDDNFAAQLCDWAERHRTTIEATRHHDSSVVENKIIDSRVSGPVIQARDIHGGITLN